MKVSDKHCIQYFMHLWRQLLYA